MPDYSSYTIEDLARDPYFRESILQPGAESDAFWKSWIGDAPERRLRYDKARILVITLHDRYKADLANDTVVKKVEQLVSQLNDGDTAGPGDETRRSNYWWRAAAALIAGLGLFWWSYRDVPETVAVHNKIEQPEDNPVITKINSTPHNQTLMLSDSSIVTLLPGSTLEFPERFDQTARLVTLSGDAFFEVMPQSKPFLVYAGETVTKVLGTRFRVTAFTDDDQVRVSVKSGKVSVHHSREYNPSETADAGPLSGIVITSHEQVVFHKTNQVLEKASLKDPAIVMQPSDSKEQVFEDTPVREVFNQLEAMYGVEIEFDENVFTNCRIITSFKDETLIERINSICQAIEATYEPSEGKVIISGNQCLVADQEKL